MEKIDRYEFSIPRRAELEFTGGCSFDVITEYGTMVSVTAAQIGIERILEDSVQCSCGS